MTIEADLKTIATAVSNIQNLLEELVAVKATQSAPAPAVEATPAPAAPAPRVEAPAPVPPPVPDFMQPAAPAVPFTNAKELTDYCKTKYLDLGPVRGGAIQSILTGMGIANVATIPVERYAEFFQKVEAL